MNRYLFSSLFTLLLPLAAVAQTNQPTNTSEKKYYPIRDRLYVTSLDGTWQFCLEGTNEWRPIRVPGNWETQNVKQAEYGRNLTKMSGTYRREFFYHEEWKGQRVVLRLDGVQHGFTAYVNKREIGNGHSAHTMHQFDITSALKQGRNEIELKVSTYSRYWLFDVCDAWSLTGIKRSVELFAVPQEASIADVIFTSKVHENNSADINIRVKTNGGYRVTAELLDERYYHVCDLQSQITADTAMLSAHLAHPRLWNAETPNLYRLRVNLYATDGRRLQQIEEKVGIREIRVENAKILLNNREIFLRGACLSENDAIEGGAMTVENRRKQLQQMKAANINFIRTAHYPFDACFARLCDEMGFYVCQEIPFASRGGEYLKNDKNVVAELRNRARATIDRDRNCPSIIMWSHGNENAINPSQDSCLLFTMQYDPTRLRGVPQAKGAFTSFIRRPSKYVNVICGHYANDGVLAEACQKSKWPIINTEFAHSLGTAFGDLEHKYEIFRREPKIAGGSVWCYQDQSILTHNFNQQKQVLKGVRIDSLRYIDNYGINPLPDSILWEKGKEGADGVVYGDGYPQDDYFELAQVYTPVAVTSHEGTGSLEIENRFNFITLNGYSLHWRLKKWQETVDEGTIWLTAKAGEKETVNIPCNATGNDLTLYYKVERPDGTLCYESSTPIRKANYPLLLTNAQGAKTVVLLREWLKKGFRLRVGRPLTIGLDYRRKLVWNPYILTASNVKVKKQKGKYHMTCRWASPLKPKNYIDGDLYLTTAKDGTITIDYTLLPSDSLGGTLLDYGLTIQFPATYTDVAWLGRGPFSQTPDKTAYNHRNTWQLHKDDIRFYGNRAEVDVLSVSSPTTSLTLCSEGRNILLENLNGNILLTDNLHSGTYGTKFSGPQGIKSNRIGKRNGQLLIKADATSLLQDIFGHAHSVNPEKPYMESYGK